MSSSKFAPAFDFYPERWTHGTRHMTKVERCDYIELLCHQWTDDGLPISIEILARILGYTNARGDGVPSKISETVLAKFPVCDDGKRRNERLELERVKQIERIEKKRTGAKITNAKRWGERVADESLSDQIATPERVADESPPPSPHLRPPVSSIEETPPNPKGEKRTRKKSNEQDPNFERFWNEYPRKEAKPRARAAWEKAKANELPEIESLLDIVWDFANCQKWKEEPQFIPHPATWLNNERWNDQLPPSKPEKQATGI